MITSFISIDSQSGISVTMYTRKTARPRIAGRSVCLGISLSLLFGVGGCASSSTHEGKTKNSVDYARSHIQTASNFYEAGPLGMIGVAVSTKAKSDIRKTTQPDPALPKGEDMPGISVVSALYGGPLMAVAVPAGLGLAAAFDWTMRQTKEGIYNTKAEVRQARNVVRATISNTTVAADLRSDTIAALSARYKTRVLSVQKFNDTQNYDRIKARGIDTLLAMDELQIGLISANRSDMMVQFVMQASVTVIDIDTETVAQRELLKYEGRVRNLSEWTANDAQEFLSELEYARLELAQNVVNRLNKTTNMHAVERTTSTESSSSQCASQYCGAYQGELVLRSGRYKTRSPLILYVDSGGIMSTVSNSEILPCKIGSPTLKVDIHGAFEDSLRGECNFSEFGKCFVYTQIRGSTEGHAARVRMHYARGLIIYRCPENTIRAEFKAEAREVSGTTSHSYTGEAAMLQPVTTLPYMAQIMQTGIGLLSSSN